jgi:mannosyltransferase
MVRKYFDVKTRGRLALACIVAVAASLDLHNLGSQPFWLDEAISVAVANSHGMSFFKLALGREVAMAFYNVILHGWLMLFSPSDFNIRLLSTIFAVGAVAALYALARKLFGPAVGLAAAGLLAVNPFFLSYAQEARSYTLTVFLTLVSWSFLIESCREPKLLNLAIYVVTTTLAIYSHNLAMLILPAQGLTLFFVQRETSVTHVRVASALCTVCVLVLPLFPIAVHFYSGNAAWIAAGIGSPGIHSLREVAVSFAGAIAPPRIRQRPLEALFAAGFLMFLARFVTAVRIRSAEVGSYALVVSAFALPIAVLMGVSQVFPIFIVRYVLICLPFLLLMIATGWVRCSQRWMAAIGLTLLVLLSLWSDQSYYSNPSKPDWRGAMEYITKNTRYGDKLAFAPAYGRLEFEHNVKRCAGRGTQLTIIYPQWNSTFEIGGKYMGGSAVMRTALNVQYVRLWIVRSDQTGDRTDQALNDLIAKYPVVVQKKFRGISVIFCGYSMPLATLGGWLRGFLA